MKKTITRAVMAAAVFVVLTAGRSFAGQDDSWTAGYDHTNNTDYVQVSSFGHVLPGTDNNIDLGAPAREFRDLYVDGTANIDTLNVDVSLGSLPSGSITTAMLATDSITTIKLLGGGGLTTNGEPVCVSGNGFDSCSDAITTAMIQTAAVTAVKIDDGAVTTAKLGTASVTAVKIDDSAVTTAKIATSAVTTAKMYLDLTTSKVACVTSAAILGVCSDAPDGSGGCTCS